MATKTAKARKKPRVEVPETNPEPAPLTTEQLSNDRDVDVFCDWIRSFNRHGFSSESGPRSPFIDEGACEHFIGQVRRYLDLTGYVGQLPPGFVQQAGKEGSGQ